MLGKWIPVGSGVWPRAGAAAVVMFVLAACAPEPGPPEYAHIVCRQDGRVVLDQIVLAKSVLTRQGWVTVEGKDGRRYGVGGGVCSFETLRPGIARR